MTIVQSIIFAASKHDDFRTRTLFSFFLFRLLFLKFRVTLTVEWTGYVGALCVEWVSSSSSVGRAWQRRTNGHRFDTRWG